MSELDDVRQAHKTIKDLIDEKSPWVQGKEREFQVVENALWNMKLEWSRRDEHFRRKGE